MIYYKLTASCVSEYLKLGMALDSIQMPCLMSEFQFLDRTPITAELDPSSGPVCQDFIYERGIPLVSERLKEYFDTSDIDYLFYKRVTLQKSDSGMSEPYWLALPPRIDCLDRSRSEIDELLGLADEIVISDNRIGRYRIFKLAGVTNPEIIVTEQLAQALREENFVGLHISPINL